MSVVSDTLAEAKRLIEERGWWQAWADGGWTAVPSPLSGPFCISTAIQLACHVDINGGFEYQRFSDAMQAVREAVGGQDPVRYNDAVGRTEAEVLNALDNAIARSA